MNLLVFKLTNHGGAELNTELQLIESDLVFILRSVNKHVQNCVTIYYNLLCLHASIAFAYCTEINVTRL